MRSTRRSESARVTRDIAERLAEVSKALEERGRDAEDVAHFLMRCIFTMFAEDVDLLPQDSFRSFLKNASTSPTPFTPRLKNVWQQMDERRHEPATSTRGSQAPSPFQRQSVQGRRAPSISAAKRSASSGGRDTTLDARSSPAIFGTLLEQALDKTRAQEARRPLHAARLRAAARRSRPSWSRCAPIGNGARAGRSRAGRATSGKAARAPCAAFHRQLCATRVLDPACGTGNFLYVSLELMKKLEGEVLETLGRARRDRRACGLDRETVDPHQFLGLELNPRAAAIAELVLWIGYLQQHYRTRTGHPAEPILRAFENINFGKRQGYDAVLTWDGYPLTTSGGEGRQARGDVSESAPAGVAGGGVYRGESAVSWAGKDHALAHGARLRGSAVGGAPR